MLVSNKDLTASPPPVVVVTPHVQQPRNNQTFGAIFKSKGK